MKKYASFLLTMAIVLSTSILQAQVYMTKAASVQFSASTPLEKIEAKNSGSTIAYDARSGNLMANVSIKGFTFESALMQEHFNENYMESDRYPVASFKGKVDDPAALDLSKKGVYTVSCTGQLSMHGAAKDVKLKATFTVKDGKVSLTGTFPVRLSDYNIKVPGVVKGKIAEEAKVSVNANLEQTKK